MVKIRAPGEEPATTEAPRKKPRMLDLPGENGDIGALLRQAAAAQRLAEERQIADLGVTPPQLAALQLIGAQPGLLAADLARKSKLTPQTMSLIVANLRRAGFLREDEIAGSRARPLSLTPTGETVLRMGRERIEASSVQLTEGLRPKREKALRRWLAAIVAGLPQPGALLDSEDL